MEELLEQREEILKDVPDEAWDKIPENTDGGSKIEVTWDNRDLPDEGYIFELPDISDSMQADVFVHIPSPDNSDGIGEAPPIFIHLLTLASMERVVNIKNI